MIVFGSRGSDLALTQTRHCADEIRRRTGEDYAIEIIETSGDRVLDRPLAEIGGKGLFTAELEAALRDGRIDAAVHSLKDLPVEDPEGLCLGAIPKRADPSDVLVFEPSKFDAEGGTIPLEGRCRVGTSSPRRRAAILNLRPDLEVVDLRGNVPTRVDKVRRGEIDAAVLAAAGLDRLGLDLAGLRRQSLPTSVFPPAPGQGALAIQCRRDDARVLRLLEYLHDIDTAGSTAAERALLAGLGGGCSMPLGALVVDDGGHSMRAALFANDGSGHGVFYDARGTTPEDCSGPMLELLQPFVGEPLAGVRVHLIRPGGGSGELGAALRVAGASVEGVALTEIRPLPADRAALGRLDDGWILAFTSARAVDRFFEEAASTGVELDGVAVFAVGPATARALVDRGVAATIPESAERDGTGLARLIGTTKPAGSVLFPCALERDGDLERELAAAGFDVHALPLYAVDTIQGAEVPAGDRDYVLFTSPSAAQAYDENQADRCGHHLAIGPTTAAAMRQRGIEIDGVATSPDARAITLLITELHHA